MLTHANLVPACLYVGLSVRSRISKIICSNFTKFLALGFGRGSVLICRQCDMSDLRSVLWNSG